MNKDTKKFDRLFSDARAALGGPLSWLGVAVAAASGVSAITRLFHVGLFGVFHDFVLFYRGLLSPFYELANWPGWPFDVPELAVDLFAVYVVLLGMSVRAELGPKIINFEVLNPDIPGKHGIIFNEFGENSWRERAKIVLSSLALLPVLKLEPIVAWVAKPPEEAEVFGDDPKGTLQLVRDIRRQDMMRFVALPVAIIIFFALSAYVPAPH